MYSKVPVRMIRVQSQSTCWKTNLKEYCRLVLFCWLRKCPVAKVEHALQRCMFGAHISCQLSAFYSVHYKRWQLLAVRTSWRDLTTACHPMKPYSRRPLQFPFVMQCGASICCAKNDWFVWFNYSKHPLSVQLTQLLNYICKPDLICHFESCRHFVSRKGTYDK